LRAAWKYSQYTLPTTTSSFAVMFAVGYALTTVAVEKLDLPKLVEKTLR
jgi:hypothetical protein